MKKTVLGALGSVAVLASAEASAAAFADTGETATFSFAGFVELLGAPGPDAGDTLSFTFLTGIIGATEEFEGLTTSSIDLGSDGFDLVLSTGADNNGESFTVDYDRSGVTDFADDSGLGSQSGTLTFTVVDTVVADLAPAAGGTQTEIDLEAVLSITDSSGFYSDVMGVLFFSSTIGNDSPLGTFSVTVSAAGNPVPVPGAISLLLTGVAGFAAFSRRRPAQ
ncbi:MAG: VPLPA-CTERM sorting domain-containing protein [Pseudomonadota bacterium]